MPLLLCFSFTRGANALPVLAGNWVANKEFVRQPATAWNGSSQQKAGRCFALVIDPRSFGRSELPIRATTLVAEWMKLNGCGLVRHNDVPPPAVSRHAKHFGAGPVRRVAAVFTSCGAAQALPGFAI